MVCLHVYFMHVSIMYVIHAIVNVHFYRLSEEVTNCFKWYEEHYPKWLHHSQEKTPEVSSPPLPPPPIFLSHCVSLSLSLSLIVFLVICRTLWRL